MKYDDAMLKWCERPNATRDDRTVAALLRYLRKHHPRALKEPLEVCPCGRRMTGDK